jgi:uncharacterized membrane protein YqiK
VSADADRIAALEAELAEACRARLEEKRLRSDVEERLVARCTQLKEVAAERDAAQAQAAAMRRKIEYYVDYPDSRCNSGDNGGCVTVQQLHAAIGTSGRALAARVPLLEAVATIALRVYDEPEDAGDWWEDLGAALVALDEKGTP